MYLSKLLIINYRSCRCVEFDVLKDEPNILIGINDCGKTSLLKGLELLLCDKPQVYCVKDSTKKKDASNSPLGSKAFSEKFNDLDIPAPPYTGIEIVVVGKFIVEDADYNDSDIQQLKAHSLWALENANDNGLWLCRTFDIEGKLKQYLLTPDNLNGEEVSSFFALTAAQLGKKRTEHSLSAEEISNSNGKGRFSNLEIVRALYSKIGSENIWVEWKWEIGLFPSFRYLDWNSSFDNILESATEALKDLIEEHLSPVKAKAREGAQAAQDALNTRLRGHKDVIASLLPQVQELSANIHFEVKEKITDLLITKLGGDGPVHMDLQGDGIKRQIWFALIKAAAVANDTDTRKKFIWAFDEPETHLYPTAQRQLFEIIKEVSSSSIQTLISTHSTVFIDRARLNAIKIISQENSYTSHSQCESIDEIFHSLEIRNSDFLFYDRFIIVEGDTEEHLIPALYKIYSGKSLQTDNIQLIHLKGASNWLIQKKALEAVFKGFRKSTENVIYLLDKDQKAKLGTSSITDNMFFVGKQDIEDALPNEIWVKIALSMFGSKMMFTIEDVETIKSKVSSNDNALSNEKFIPLFVAALRGRAADLEIDTVITIPQKGYELATAILEHLIEREQIPIEICNCFEKLTTSLSPAVIMDEDVLLELNSEATTS